jgi:RRXRR protein
MVYVLDKRHKPLMPCPEKGARILQAKGRARASSAKTYKRKGK